MALIRKIGNDNEVDMLLNRSYTFKARSGFIEVGADKICLPVYYDTYEESINNFKVYEDDVFICGHPRTGTTWCAELVWLILNNLNYEDALETEIFRRVPQLGFNFIFEVEKYIKNENNDFTSIKYTAEAKRPRCIKTYLPWSLLPEQIRNSSTKPPKVIVTLRNPEDSCISYYYYSKATENYAGTFSEFCRLFLAGRVCFGPFWKHVLSYWEQRDRPNLLFIKYKEIEDDLSGVIRKVATFLGKTLSEEETKKLAEHLNFESMIKNPAVNHKNVFEQLKVLGYTTSDNPYLRSEKVGTFKSKMDTSMIKIFKKWSEENIAGTGLSVE